jgi:serine/arginine repetitive matrix protein 1
MSAALTTNVDQRLLRTTKFPPEFNTKVDLKKVNVQLIKAWVGDEIARILKSEDDIVTELINNILEESRYVSAGYLQKLLLRSGSLWADM